MKAKTLILPAALALAAAVACKKENKENPVFEGDTAYISVNIAYSDASTKGDAATPPFYAGSADENAVSTAHFFFYNADGSYATYASKVITTSASGTPDSSTSNNVEAVGEAVVVLSGLKSTNYPTYMAVLLNPNGTMVADLQSKSITEAQAYVIAAIAIEGTSTATGPSTDWTDFVMTSSTFSNGDARTGYFCEKLVAENFQEDETSAKAHPVTAYVERLAAKVMLTLGGAAEAKIGSFEVDGAAKDLYYKILGWGLNATTKQTFTYKNIDPSWSITGFDATKWNDATNHRSYWAKTPVYGTADRGTVTIGYATPSTETLFYPDNYADVQRNPTLTPTLNYVSYNDLKVSAGSNAYCRENTNGETVLRAVNFSAAATSVLLKAQVQDDAGHPVQLVNYVKKLYTFDGYKTQVLATYAANHAGALIYKGDAATKTAIDITDLEEVNAYDAYVTLKLKALATGDYYFYDGSSFTLTTADDATEALNGGAAATTPETKAEYYKDGMMYYNVPIEHLNNSGVKYGKTGFSTGLIEADYGVVRNHYYQVDITAIKNLGKAVYDPSEPIVPSDDDLKDYYVGAKINILSWKVVKQSVEL